MPNLDNGSFVNNDGHLAGLALSTKLQICPTWTMREY